MFIMTEAGYNFTRPSKIDEPLLRAGLGDAVHSSIVPTFHLGGAGDLTRTKCEDGEIRALPRKLSEKKGYLRKKNTISCVLPCTPPAHAAD